MDLAAIAMLSIYIGLAVIPLLYNHKTYSTPPTPAGTMPKPQPPPKQINRSVVVFLNNLTDEQIKKIIEETKTILTSHK